MKHGSKGDAQASVVGDGGHRASERRILVIFERFPIRLAWFALVLPALLLNYFGQASPILLDPEQARQPFFRSRQGWRGSGGRGMHLSHDQAKIRQDRTTSFPCTGVRFKHKHGPGKGDGRHYGKTHVRRSGLEVSALGMGCMDLSRLYRGREGRTKG